MNRTSEELRSLQYRWHKYHDLIGEEETLKKFPELEEVYLRYLIAERQMAVMMKGLEVELG
jgi:hypothetical protein